jgi:branched-chain amino acid transport system permease protein
MQLRPEGAFRMTNERSGLRGSRPVQDPCHGQKTVLDDAI